MIWKTFNILMDINTRILTARMISFTERDRQMKGREGKTAVPQAGLPRSLIPHDFNKH